MLACGAVRQTMIIATGEIGMAGGLIAQMRAVLAVHDLREQRASLFSLRCFAYRSVVVQRSHLSVVGHGFPAREKHGVTVVKSFGSTLPSSSKRARSA